MHLIARYGFKLDKIVPLVDAGCFLIRTHGPPREPLRLSPPTCLRRFERVAFLRRRARIWGKGINGEFKRRLEDI